MLYRILFIVSVALSCIPVPGMAAIFTVNQPFDTEDGDLADGICDTGNGTDGFTGVCTLRAALVTAQPGDFIGFAANISTIFPDTALPPLHASIVGSTSRDRVKLNGMFMTTPLAAGLRVRQGAEFVDSLVINRFPGDGLDVNIGADGGLQITNCIIGLDPSGRISGDFGNGGDGIFVELSDHVVIGGGQPQERNVIGGNGSAGIRIWGRNFFAGPATGNQIIGNSIGTDAGGTLRLGNGASGIILGEDDLAIVETLVLDNVISANGMHGMEVRGKRVDNAPFSADFNRIIGNRIGTTGDGLAALGNNRSGIFLWRNDETIIGEPSDPAAGTNVISGNREHGIAFGNSLSDSLTVVGNIIGANANAAAPIPNEGHGVYVSGGTVGFIGGTGDDPSAQGNIIAFNRGAGVAIVEMDGNATRFSIRGNAIYDNGGLGIDLNADGVTPNDPLDTDNTGGNNQQNWPVVSEIHVENGMTTVSGVLDDIQNNPHRFDFYSNPGGCDSSGFGEGDAYLGSFGPTSNPGFQVPIPFSMTFTGEHPRVSVTATDVAGNTSEFSACDVPFVVNSVADNADENPGDGLCDTGNMIGDFLECTLRAAIEESNALAEAQTVHFEIPDDQSTNGVFIISVGGSLPIIEDAVVINATTQPDYAGSPIVELSGPGGNAPSWGFQVLADDTTISGFSIYGFAKNGVLVDGVQRATLESNVVGTNAAGNAGPTLGEDGVLLRNASQCRIGGAVAQANVVSHNGFAGTGGCGLTILGGGENSVIANRIGTDFTGTSALENGKSGICIVDSSFNLIGGSGPGEGNLISGNLANGIDISGASAVNNRILGNRIGVNQAGGAAIANGRNGVFVAGNSGGGEVVGDGTPSGRNVIAGNDEHGVRLQSSIGFAAVDGNFIGLNAAGNAAVGNQSGVYVEDSPNNRIGVVAPNVVSGNREHGIYLTGNATLNTQIQDNLIGTDATGINPVPNTLDGIRVAGARGAGISGNTIANNGGNGVHILGRDAMNQLNPSQAQADHVIADNFVGEALDGAAAGNGNDGVRISNSSGNRVTGNTVRSSGTVGVSVAFETYGTDNGIDRNDIFGNVALGIDLGDDFVTANDALDADTGANQLQNFPLITNIVGAPLNFVQGTLSAEPNTEYIVELFSNSTADPSGFGEGEFFEGAFYVATNGAGEAVFNGGYGRGTGVTCISATARNVQTDDTSEFSPCEPIPPPVPTNIDYGDAFEADGQYPTRLSSNGARHQVSLGVFMGSQIDADPDGQPDLNATGDDLDGSSDEDGVHFPGRLESYTSNALVEVSVNAAGFVDAWLDGNGDRHWLDAGEQILESVAVIPGTNVLMFTLPTDVSPGTAIVRFRFSTAGNLEFVGPALDGEVEDYAVPIVGPIIFVNGFE